MLKAFGANLTAALLPVGDKHSSPITQMIYERITQLTLNIEPSEECPIKPIMIYEAPANNAPKTNFVALLGWGRAIFAHMIETTGASNTINSGLIDWKNI